MPPGFAARRAAFSRWARSPSLTRRSPRGLVLFAVLLTTAAGAAIAIIAGARPADWSVAPLGEDLASQALARGDLDEAIRLLTARVERSPQDAEAHALLGAAWERKSNRSLALLHYQKALAAEPRQADANRGIGRIYLAMGLAQAAIPYLEQAVREKPTSADWRALGRARLRCREPIEAAFAFQKAVELDPADLESARLLESLLTGRAADVDPHVVRPTAGAPATDPGDALESTGRRR